jgi:hypothetical protein
MPRPKSLVTVLRELVRDEVTSALGSLLGTAKPKAKNGRRRKPRGRWRPGGPGRPPKAVTEKAARRLRKRKAG